jgi:23S rRNA (uracil1939-C5)-methyltransferase
VLEAVLEAVPARITYVSCHAATLARDLRKLGSAYRVEHLALLDLFPQSGHLEAVVQLRRTSGV